MNDERFDEWIRSAEQRHLAELTFREVSRALRALSSTYVERRGRLGEGAALSGAGKRAAFALFYGPLHFLIVGHIVKSLGAATAAASTVVDLGCGTGAAGAAWAESVQSRPAIIGIDRHPWAVDEAKQTYRMFGISARVRVGDASRTELPPRSAALAAFTVNELAGDARDHLLRRLLAHGQHGGVVLVVEPLAGFVAPWWRGWQRAFEEAGGRADEWRLRPELPSIVAKLDRAAGMNHREITGRSLWLGSTTA
jgi:SAM-dependent methyltransferase